MAGQSRVNNGNGNGVFVANDGDIYMARVNGAQDVYGLAWLGLG